VKTSRKQTILTGIEALATQAWNTYYELVCVAAKNGFTVKDKSATTVVLQHPSSSGEIFIRIDVTPKKA
jgi:hypothetical protein